MKLKEEEKHKKLGIITIKLNFVMKYIKELWNQKKKKELKK